MKKKFISRVWDIFLGLVDPSRFQIFFFKNVRTFFFNFFFKSDQIYMKDPESAESKEKSNFRFWPISIFRVMVIFWSFLWRHDNSKTKNRKKIIFRFSFYLAHSALSIKPDQNWEEGGCMSLDGKRQCMLNRILRNLDFIKIGDTPWNFWNL